MPNPGSRPKGNSWLQIAGHVTISRCRVRGTGEPPTSGSRNWPNDGLYSHRPLRSVRSSGHYGLFRRSRHAPVANSRKWTIVRVLCRFVPKGPRAHRRPFQSRCLGSMSANSSRRPHCDGSMPIRGGNASMEWTYHRSGAEEAQLIFLGSPLGVR
jgi:hypothetical protein